MENFKFVPDVICTFLVPNSIEARFIAYYLISSESLDFFKGGSSFQRVTPHLSYLVDKLGIPSPPTSMKNRPYKSER